MEDCDVLVVGAGAVGLSTAIFLALRGVRVRIIDRNAEVERKTKAAVVHTRSLELLPTAVVERIQRESVLLDQFRIFEHTASGLESVVRFELQGVGDSFPSMRTMEQWRLELILSEFLETLEDGVPSRRAGCGTGGKPGMRVRRGVTLESLEEDLDGVECLLSAAGSGAKRTSTRLRARWVVGADGGHSRVRTLLGIDLAGSTREETFLIFHAFLERMDEALVAPTNDLTYIFSKGPKWRLLHGPASAPGPREGAADRARPHARAGIALSHRRGRRTRSARRARADCRRVCADPARPRLGARTASCGGLACLVHHLQGTATLAHGACRQSARAEPLILPRGRG
jgi:2-polyprenyl-6-methoxyphenol hydroxylase-like FAD-dependent oxidoreductase